MKLTFLDRESLGFDLDLSFFDKLGKVQIFNSTSLEERIDHIGESDVLVFNRVVMDKAILTACPTVKLLSLTATGYNNVDLTACKEAGIGVCNVVGYSTASVVQHTLNLFLTLTNPLSMLNSYVLSGQWSKQKGNEHLKQTWSELTGKRWGIIGMGQIGRGVGAAVQALGAEVFWASASGSERKEPYPQLSLDQLIKTCDVISLHCPLNESTKQLINSSRLKQMKPQAFLINVGRGGLIDEKALAEALDNQRLAGAGLDVLSSEPPTLENPLLHLKHPEKILISPHIAWASREARKKCMEEVYLNIEAWTQGLKRNRVD